MGAPTHNPTLHTAIECAFFALLGETVHTALPGIIDKYDPSSRKASVKPMLQSKNIDETATPLPIISNVPVVWPGNSLGSLSFPLTRGDGVLILFSERSLDEWLSSGKDVAPDDDRMFSLNDAIAIPGLFSFDAKSTIDNNDDMQISYKGKSVFIRKNGDVEVKGGNTVIVRNNGDVEIGGSGLKKLVTDSLLDAFNNHVHGTGSYASISGVTGGPLVAGGFSGAPTVSLTDSVLTTKVKAQ